MPFLPLMPPMTRLSSRWHAPRPASPTRLDKPVISAVAVDFTLDRVKAGGYTVACRDKRHLLQACMPAAARVAQLVEQRIENPRVGGSNPPPGTIYPKQILDFLPATPR